MFGEKLFNRVIGSLNSEQIAKMQRLIIVRSAHLAQTLSAEMLEAKRLHHAKRAMRPFTSKASIIENTVWASAANRALSVKERSEELAA